MTTEIEEIRKIIIHTYLPEQNCNMKGTFFLYFVIVNVFIEI